nr:RNA-directed DNA polymerase, eukaryota, reverse transcriptase zinc-binding domain protein [Tanacetum cinerariifolium]
MRKKGRVIPRNTVKKMDSMDNSECDGINVEEDSTMDCVKSEGTGSRTPKINKTAMSMNLIDNDRKLECIPTEIDEIGVEVVVFDEIIVAVGIKRWDLTLCGFFCRAKMSVNELRYNLKRMWSIYGFKDIVDYSKGVFFIKFHHEDGLNNVVNSGPWMVNRKPLMVQKIGKPLVMDDVTASKCRQGIGMLRSARVLIECRKNVNVLYDWKPLVCFECGVFGHAGSSYPKNEPIKSINVNSKQDDTVVQKEIIDAYKEVNYGFVEVESRKNVGIDNKVKRPRERNEEEDVLQEVNDIAKNMKGNDVRVWMMGNWVCAVLETHLKSKKVDKVCERIYGRWNWITNMRYCNKGCRIMIGWNEDEVSISIIHMERESVLLKMETRNNIKMFGTFIYAANGGIERKDLWKDLEIYRRIVGILVNHLWGRMEEGVNVQNCQKDERLEEAGLEEWGRLKMQQRNKIDVVCDENGKRFEGSEVTDQFVIQFHKFLGEIKDVEKISDMGSLLQNKLSIEDATFMIRKISNKDIKHAMFQIDDNKDPDQMQLIFSERPGIQLEKMFA